eukprot:TRINITY_DN68751_c0_g1_i1.p2 TRINITY_DN68751_c0_g1~~TRINITY_DN68751_c0_g1_i1.p2  ORF type:complete len:173 (-),score=28.39 TRINITY_DN68751_c0_g1_i1:442-960(-)
MRDDSQPPDSGRSSSRRPSSDIGSPEAPRCGTPRAMPEGVEATLSRTRRYKSKEVALDDVRTIAAAPLEHMLEQFERACEDAAQQGHCEVDWDTFEKLRVDRVFEIGCEQLTVSMLGQRLDAIGFTSVSVHSIDHTWTGPCGDTQRGWFSIAAAWPEGLLGKADAAEAETTS